MMGTGTTIAYQLGLHGIPIRWTSEITGWEPPFKFVDAQRRRLYRFWKYEHTFVGQNGYTTASDPVRYVLWSG